MTAALILLVAMGMLVALAAWQWSVAEVYAGPWAKGDRVAMAGTRRRLSIRARAWSRGAAALAVVLAAAALIVGIGAT